MSISKFNLSWLRYGLVLLIVAVSSICDSARKVSAEVEQPVASPSGLVRQSQAFELRQLQSKELPANIVLAQDSGHTIGPDGKATSGELQFREYCAQCHGKEGTGDGPVASELKTKPANLTLLSKNNGGVFPASEVHDFIVGTKTIASHGTREMPIWGYAFMFRQGALAGPFGPVLTPLEVDDKINLLVDYVKSIQRK
jgi:mono/diheme cytochrome c family protein